MDCCRRLRTTHTALLFALIAGAPCAARALDVQVTDTHGRPVADAVVIVRGADPAAGPATDPPAPAAMRQLNKAFVPYVLAVRTGTAVTFPNEDPYLHHVYSFAQAKSFDLELYGGGEIPQVLFDEPGVIGLGCNIHDSMRGYIVVIDSPWFAVTDADGRAELAPPRERTLTLEVWHHQQATPAAAPAPLVDVAGTLAITLALKPRVPSALNAHEAGDY